jgi:hypothetical protein
MKCHHQKLTGESDISIRHASLGPACSFMYRTFIGHQPCNCSVCLSGCTKEKVPSHHYVPLARSNATQCFWFILSPHCNWCLTLKKSTNSNWCPTKLFCLAYNSLVSCFLVIWSQFTSIGASVWSHVHIIILLALWRSLGVHWRHWDWTEENVCVCRWRLHAEGDCSSRWWPYSMSVTVSGARGTPCLRRSHRTCQPLTTLWFCSMAEDRSRQSPSLLMSLTEM